MAYDKPEQPPPCTPTRRPPSSVETPSFSRSARILRAARSVSVIFAVVGVASSVAITNPFQGYQHATRDFTRSRANTVLESVNVDQPATAILVGDFCYGR